MSKEKIEPLKGISKIANGAYRINCECTSQDHTVDCWIEVDHAFEDNPELLSITHYVTMYSKCYENLWQRIKAACNILFKGVDIKEHEILLTDEAARNWIKAIQSKLKTN